MKSLKKSLIALLTVLLIVPVLAGCSKSTATVEKESKEIINESSTEAIKNYLDNNLAAVLTTYDYDTFVSALDQGAILVSIPFDVDLKTRWGAFVEKHGQIVDAYTIDVEKEGYEFEGYIALTGEDGEMMRLNIKMSQSATPLSATLEAYSDDSGQTLAGRLAEAGGNTISGIIVVFFVLAFLCILISCFKFVNVIGKKKTPKTAPATEKQTSAAPAAPVQADPVKEVDDKELIAVIAAAIAASGNTSPDQLIVRSIKRLNNNKW